MKQFLQPIIRRKKWMIVGGLGILGIALIGSGLSPSAPVCSSNVMELSCGECLAANAASSGMGDSISGCLPFPFAMWLYSNYNKVSILFGFVMGVMTAIAGVRAYFSHKTI
jgi:hypothetical protein